MIILSSVIVFSRYKDKRTNEEINRHRSIGSSKGTQQMAISRIKAGRKRRHRDRGGISFEPAMQVVRGTEIIYLFIQKG